MAARHHPIWQLTLVKIRELAREPEAVFWVFAFPVLLALALGIAFRARGPETLTVGVQIAEGMDSVVASLESAPSIRVRVVQDSIEARELLRTGGVALVVVPGAPFTYWFDPTRPESRLAHMSVDDALQRAGGRQDPYEVTDRHLTEKGSRYIDFLIPGLLGMNLMGTGIWGVGFAIVQARQRRVLKRLLATPMRRSHFLLGQINGRMIFLIPEVATLLVFAYLAFGVPVHGSLVSLTIVCLLGAMTFAGVGLLVASRARTVEGVSGIMNLVMAPMWILSGIFFSTSRFPEAMQPAIQALPLTAVNDQSHKPSRAPRRARA